MATFKFEISNLIEVKVAAETVEDARMLLIENQAMYESELADDCYISDGDEVE